MMDSRQDEDEKRLQAAPEELNQPPFTQSKQEQGQGQGQEHGLGRQQQQGQTADEAARGDGGDGNDSSAVQNPFKLTILMAGLFLSIFTVNLDATIIATAIPYITDDFNVLTDVGWYIASHFLTSAAFQTAYGKAYKFFPLKSTFLVSLFIFEIGSLISALSPNSVSLIIGRAIVGLGSAGVSVGVFIAIAFAAPPQHVSAFIGGTGATYSLAAILGPILGGAFTKAASWRWCFWINLPIGAVTAVIVIFLYKTPPVAAPPVTTWKRKLLELDPSGIALIMSLCVCFTLPLQWGGTTKSWKDSTVIGTLVGFVLLTVAFIANEFWVKYPLLEGRIIRIRRVWANCVTSFFISGGFFTLIYYMPIYFQSIRGVDPLESGIRSLPLSLSAVFTLLAGFVVGVVPRSWAPMQTAGATLGTVGSGLIYTLGMDSPAREWIGYQALAGIGIGTTLQIAIMANQAAAKTEDVATTSAITLFFQLMSGFFCVAAAQAGFGSTLVSKAAVYVPGIDTAKLLGVGATELRHVYPPDELPGIMRAYMDGLTMVFVISTALIGIGFVFSLIPRWEKLKPEEGEKSGEETA